MEKIDLNNYEAYFLDFMEGTLSVEEKHDLFTFLEAHPELKSEMDELDSNWQMTLMPEKVTFTDKAALKIDESQLILTPNTVEDVMIASMEGQLTEAHQKELATYIKANGLEKTYAYYRATVLKPDTTVTFADKKRLKVKTGVVISMPLIARVASVAAVGALFIMLAMNWNSPAGTNENTNSNPAFAADVKDANFLDRFIDRNIGGSEVIENELNDLVAPNQSNGINRNNNQVIDELRNDAIAFEENPVEEKIDSSNFERAPQKDDGGLIDPNDIVQQEKQDDGNPPKILDKIEDEEPEVILASIETEEPYKLVTDAASNIVNTDIKFTRDRNVNSNDYVAYSFKLGKFEFERKKSR